MNRFYFDKENGGKLVRDKIVELTNEQKHVVESRKLTEKDLASAVLGKIPEELEELKQELEKGDVFAEKKEIADLMTLLNAYIEARGFDKSEIKEIEAKKTKAKGGFKSGEVIEYIELNPEGDEYEFWLQHFRDNPDRYTEESEEE